MDLKKLKWVFVSITTIYLLSYFIIPSIFEDGEQYLKFYDSFKRKLADIIFGDPITNTDAYIVNTYYYPKSKSLGENALAMVLLMNRNTMRDITKYKMQLVATNGSSQVTVVPKILVESYSDCTYVNVVATTNSLPDLTKLEITDGETRMEIPFRQARTSAPAPVIICLSPQFIAEQWQIFVAHAHIAHHFGGHLHLYVTSMLQSYFDLVKEYEKLGYVTIDYWMRMKFENSTLDSPDLNANVEWRNQAGAHTDCLLQYKEAASFVAFFDLDDILIPRGFNSYFDEFSSFLFLNPNILTLQYPKREMMLHNKPTISDINFQEVFGHSWFVNREDAGKIVARPSNLNSMWIHRSFNVPDKHLHIVKNNFLMHMQKPFDTDGQNSVPFGMSKYEIMDGLKLNNSVLTLVQTGFERFLNSTAIQEIAVKLPIHSYYFAILFRCYFQKGYLSTCPNSEGCLIPQRSDLPCIHSDADYKSGPQMNPITFHYHENPQWSHDIGCYT